MIILSVVIIIVKPSSQGYLKCGPNSPIQPHYSLWSDMVFLVLSKLLLIIPRIFFVLSLFPC